MAQADGTFTDPLLNDLSCRFAAHAAIYRGTSKQNASPLYAHLSQLIATDAEMLQLVSDADRATQVSNLLFGAVHFLLLRGVPDPLADFYASLTPTPRPLNEAYPLFRAFCLTHADTIRQLVSARRVQTNEVQRCTGLLLAFTAVARQYVPHPLALVEVGASAGLNLLWDQFGYTYDPLGTVGDVHSPVQLHCTITGNQLPSLPIGVPAVAARIGLDLIPVDVCDEEATGWIRALIWPEQRDRADHFEQALAFARRDPRARMSTKRAIALL